MAVKEELLRTVFDIYQAEAGITWHDTVNDYGMAVPLNRWSSQDGTFEFRAVDFECDPQTPDYIAVTAANIYACATPDLSQAQIKLESQSRPRATWERKLDRQLYDNAFAREVFLEPLARFLAEHDHDLCIKQAEEYSKTPKTESDGQTLATDPNIIQFPISAYTSEVPSATNRVINRALQLGRRALYGR